MTTEKYTIKKKTKGEYNYKTQLDILLDALYVLKQSPQKKYYLMCELHTNTRMLNRYLDMLIARKLVFHDGEKYHISNRGLELLRLLDRGED